MTQELILLFFLQFFNHAFEVICCTFMAIVLKRKSVFSYWKCDSCSNSKQVTRWFFQKVGTMFMNVKYMHTHIVNWLIVFKTVSRNVYNKLVTRTPLFTKKAQCIVIFLFPDLKKIIQETASKDVLDFDLSWRQNQCCWFTKTMTNYYTGRQLWENSTSSSIACRGPSRNIRTQEQSVNDLLCNWLTVVH